MSSCSLKGRRERAGEKHIIPVLHSSTEMDCCQL